VLHANKHQWRPPPGPSRIDDVSTLTLGNNWCRSLSSTLSTKSMRTQISAGCGSHLLIFSNRGFGADRPLHTGIIYRYRNCGCHQALVDAVKVGVRAPLILAVRSVRTKKSLKRLIQKSAVCSDEIAPKLDYRTLQNQVRELHRLLGKKTLEAATFRYWNLTERREV
jgi:hypothetical protein